MENVSTLQGGGDGERVTGAYFAKCFFFVAFSFWLTGVIMLSVGEMYVGLLSGHTNKAHRGRKAD